MFIINGKIGRRPADCIAQIVGHRCIERRTLQSISLVPFANVRGNGTQKIQAHGKLAALCLLFRGTWIADTDGHCTHITHVFPSATDYGTHFSAESSKDSLFDFSHNCHIFRDQDRTMRPSLKAETDRRQQASTMLLQQHGHASASAVQLSQR